MLDKTKIPVMILHQKITLHIKEVFLKPYIYHITIRMRRKEKNQKRFKEVIYEQEQFCSDTTYGVEQL